MYYYFIVFYIKVLLLVQALKLILLLSQYGTLGIEQLFTNKGAEFLNLLESVFILLTNIDIFLIIL